MNVDYFLVVVRDEKSFSFTLSHEFVCSIYKLLVCRSHVNLPQE